MAGATPRTVQLQELTVDVSLSGVARGDLLYRGASKWNNLAAGTSGYYLKSNGAGADPSWASVSLSPAGSSGQVQYNNAGAFGGAALLNYATSGSILTITDGATTDVPLVVNGVASQSGDLLQLKVNGTTLTKVNSSGAISFGTNTATIGVGASNTIKIAGNAGGWGYLSCRNYGGDGSGTSGVTISQVVRESGSPNLWLIGQGGSILLDPGGASVGVQIRGTTSQSAPLLQLQGQSSTTAGTAQAEVDTAWNNSTHASRSADLILRAYYTTTAREGLRIRGGSSDVQLGFYGVTPISCAVLATGAGATVDNVIAALQNLGLVKQS